MPIHMRACVAGDPAPSPEPADVPSLLACAVPAWLDVVGPLVALLAATGCWFGISGLTPGRPLAALMAAPTPEGSARCDAPQPSPGPGVPHSNQPVRVWVDPKVDVAGIQKLWGKQGFEGCSV